MFSKSLKYFVTIFIGRSKSRPHPRKKEVVVDIKNVAVILTSHPKQFQNINSSTREILEKSSKNVAKLKELETSRVKLTN